MITKLNIRLIGDSCLREKSEVVAEVDNSERILIRLMLATMYEGKGIGLAAPQVGINKCILVADVGDGPVVIFNPVIIKQSGSDVMEEGCLSVPEETVVIKRSKKILLKYLDQDNNVVEQEFNDLLARVILHEMDHLEGKLIVDYASLEENIHPQKSRDNTLKNKI